jgi:ectoine hydroxylase-related dioxygenase (phytanoyl-CoA dioxygenase family)
MWKIPKDTPQTAVPNGHTKLFEATYDTPLDEIFKHFDEDGGVILKGLLTPDEAAQFRDELKPSLTKVQQGSLYAAYAERLADFHGRKTRRIGGLTNLSSVFRDRLVENDFIHELCMRVFTEGGHAGNYWLSQATTIWVEGAQAPQELHRDLQTYPPYVLLGKDATEAMLNFIVALTPFNAENGATAVIPGSNHWDFDQRGSQDQTIPAVMEPGDALLFGGKIVHGTGRSVVDDQERGCIQFVVIPSFLTPSEAHPLIVDHDVVRGMSKRAQQFLGFRSTYPRDSTGMWTKDYQELALHMKYDDPTPRVAVIYEDQKARRVVE